MEVSFMFDIMVLLWGMIGAASIAFIGYARQAVKENPEDFQLKKALPTVILGAGIGVAFALAGTPVTEAAVMEQLALYGFLTFAIENGLKIVYRWIGNLGAVGPTT